MERFAERHRQTLNELLGTDFGKSPSDSTVRLLLAQPGVVELDSLVCDGKTLRGSIAETDSGAAKFIGQESLYSKSHGVAIAQTTYATDASGEIQALRQLLEAVELDGILVQADALHVNRLFPLPRQARRRLPDCRQTKSSQRVSADQRQAQLRPPDPVAHQQTGGETGQ